MPHGELALSIWWAASHWTINPASFNFPLGIRLFDVIESCVFLLARLLLGNTFKQGHFWLATLPYILTSLHKGYSFFLKTKLCGDIT